MEAKRNPKSPAAIGLNGHSFYDINIHLFCNVTPLTLQEHLLKLKKWWERNEWLGSEDTEIRKQIKECFTRELELIDPICEFPLFRFVLQLIFSKKAGSTADAAECPDYPMVSVQRNQN